MTFRPGHLIARFVRSFRSGRVEPVDHEWIASLLSPSELVLFDRMQRQDQLHSLAVARRVESTIGEVAIDLHAVVFAAALLHDVGKSAAQLGTYGRVVATLSGVVGGHDLAELWQRRSGFTRKVGLYLRYGEIGADMLRMAGSDPLVVAWSTEHHLAPDQWTMPAEAGRVLAAADG